MTVLVVDDDADTRELVRRVLMTDFEVRIVECSDARTALQRLTATPIDFMLLDLHMPDMNGIDVLEYVRRSPAHAGMRVVLMTGMADAEAVRAAVRLGVSVVLVKPLTPTLLRDRLSRVISGGQNAIPRQDASATSTQPTQLAATAPAPMITARELFDPGSPSVGAVLEAACKLISDPLRQPISAHAVTPETLPSITARWIYGSVHLQSAQGGRGTWELCVHLPFTVALRLGAATHRTTLDQLTAADVRDVVLNVALELGTLLRDLALDRGVRLRVTSGRSGEQPAGALFRTLQHGPGVSRCLIGDYGVPSGAIQLIAHAMTATAR